MKLLTGLVSLLVGIASCARDLPGETPPEKSLYFPIGLALSPATPPSGERYAYVLSSNFDLRFNAGWISVVDVMALKNGAERDAVLGRLRVPSLGGHVALNAAGTLAVIAHRGTGTNFETPLLSVIEISDDGATLSCGDTEATADLNTLERRTDCDRAHLVRVDAAAGWDPAPTQGALNDPYALNVLEIGGATYVTVGFLTSDRVLVYRYEPEGESRLVPVQLLGLGASGIGRLIAQPGTASAFLAATSRFFAGGVGSTLYSIDLERTLNERRDVIYRQQLDTTAGGAELVDVTFTPGGDRAYATNNTPDSLVVLDTSFVEVEEQTGPGVFTHARRPGLRVLDALAVEGQPSGLAFVARPTGDLLAVTSFKDDILFLFSAVGDRLLPAVRLDDVGAGPFQIVAIPDSDGTLLVMTTFFDHGLSLVRTPNDDLRGIARVAQLRDSEFGVANGQR